MSLDLGQLTLWQNITVAVLVGLTFIFLVIQFSKIYNLGNFFQKRFTTGICDLRGGEHDFV